MFKLLIGFLVVCFLIPKVSFAHDGIHEIKLVKNGFEPSQLQIDQGEVVTFINNDETERWPASNIHPTHGIYPNFDPKRPIKLGEEWKFQFDKGGVFRFHDHLIPEFNGIITVSPTSVQPQSTKNIQEILQVIIKKLYYLISPKSLENDLGNLNSIETASDPEKLNFWLQIIGGKKYIQKMVADSDGGSSVDCHQEAHLVGRAAYELEGSGVFQSMDYNCHSGFLHGAMEAFIATIGGKDLPKNVTSLCSSFKTDFTKFECLHGIGHGFTAYMDYDIPKALGLCKQLENDYARRSCFGGVFMENILVAEGRGANKGHSTKWVSEDPHFPCNALEKDYLIQYECYQMQTSRMLDISGYDFQIILSECPKAPVNVRNICYKSMGRDAAGQTLRDPKKIYKICSDVPKQYFNDCMEGALNVVVEFWGENMADQPHAVCNMLSPDDKKICYGILGMKSKQIFGENKDKIKSICSLSEQEFIDTCLTASK